MPLNGFLTPVLADTEKTITGLGIGAIGDPVAPEDVNSYWTGSYVYYGKYYRNNIETAEPVKYRVLDSAATEFGGNTLFLDCHTVLYKDYFDKDRTPNRGAQKANEWAYSDVKNGLIGENFLEKDGCFTGPEKKAITESTVGTHTVTVGSPDNSFNNFFTDYTELHGDTVFLLDVGDVLNPAYGYSSDCGIDMNHFGTVECRKKAGLPYGWWLRSSANNNDIGAGGVYSLGFVCVVDVSNPDSGGGVSPAFNVDLSSIIFTSLISGTAGEPRAEYKLTLKDDNMNIAVTYGKAVTRKDDTVTVPYTITTGTNAGNATQVSVLITDKPYEAGKAVTSGFYYKKLNVGSWNTSGTGTFDIPNTYRDKIWGKDYHIYILAEDVNGEKETDYASKPVEIHVHTLKHYDRKELSDTSDGNIEYWECLGCGELFSDAEGTQVVSKKDTVIPKLKKISATATGYSGKYDGKAHGITVKVTDPSSGAAVRYGTVEGTYGKTTSPEYTEVGTYTVYYEITAEGYKTLEGKETVEIKKEEPKNEPVITPSDNKAMDERPETVDGDYQVFYAHQIPFPGKGKLTAESFGENFTVSQGNATYKVKKIKANKKKHRIQILKLENAPKDVEKAVKKATKGDKGIPYTQNPYYVRDTDKVTAKFKKSGAAASVKVNINGKDYKAKKGEYEYNDTSKLILFKGENLAGSWTVK